MQFVNQWFCRRMKTATGTSLPWVTWAVVTEQKDRVRRDWALIKAAGTKEGPPPPLSLRFIERGPAQRTRKTKFMERGPNPRKRRSTCRAKASPEATVQLDRGPRHSWQVVTPTVAVANSHTARVWRFSCIGIVLAKCCDPLAPSGSPRSFTQVVWSLCGFRATSTEWSTSIALRCDWLVRWYVQGLIRSDLDLQWNRETCRKLRSEILLNGMLIKSKAEKPSNQNKKLKVACSISQTLPKFFFFWGVGGRGRDWEVKMAR